MASAWCVGPAAFAQTLSATAKTPAPPYAAPRTSFGQPNLEGAWSHNYFLIIEAPPGVPNLVVSEAEAKIIAQKVGGRVAEVFDKGLDPEIPDVIRSTDGLGVVRGQRRSRSVVEPADGKLPYTAAARQEIAQRPRSAPLDNPEERPNWERCVINQGLPPITRDGSARLNPVQIVQTPTHVVIHSEYGDEARLIPLTDKHGPKALKPLLGDSIARWEGDTLVIETTGLPEKDRIRPVSNLIVSSESTVIERYTRIADNELLYQYTVRDPKVYSAPWLAEYSLYKTDEPLFEHACHEGNHSLPNILQGARVTEAREAAKASR